MNKDNFVSGWLKQPDDSRDLRFAVSAPVKLPSEVNLSIGMGPILDQGKLGSCTANAIATAIFHARSKRDKIFQASRLFIYYNERAMIGTVNEDSGAYIRDGFKSIAKQGAPYEKQWPYDIARFREKPPAEVYTAALENQAIKYYAVRPTVEAVKEALAAGYSVVFGFLVFESFFKITKKKPRQPMPKAGEQVMGGHAVIVAGYNNRRRAFKVQNSWGYNWGQNGTYWMPYTYLSDTDYCSDFWVLETIE